MIVSVVWRLLDRRQRLQLLGLQLVAVLMALATVTGIAAILPFLAVLAEPASMYGNPLLRALAAHLPSHLLGPHLALALGLAFVALVLLANLINIGGMLLMSRFAFEVGTSLNTTLFEDYLTRPYDFHLRTHSATLTARLLHETGRVTVGVLQSGLMLVASVVTVAVVVLSMMLVEPLIATAAILTLGTSYGVIYVAVRGRLLRNGAEESGRYAERTLIVAESLGAVKEILLARAQAPFAARYAASCRSISRTALSTFAISQTPRYALEIATVSALAGSAIYLGAHGGRHGPWVAALSFIGLAVYRLLPALQQAFASLVNIRAHRPALANVAEDLRRARERAAMPPAPAIDLAWRGRPRRELRLDDISFRYPSEASEALSGLSLRIPAGAVVGIVGDNGSGKTTLLDVLAGILVPQSGTLTVDGVAIDASNRAAWQSTIAYVPQQLFLLDASLEENIALGGAIVTGDRERLRRAIALSRLQEWAARSSAPAGARLGERGARLSGGQRQRVGIARALYREASVLIMDEATSELDADTEQEIIEAVARLAAQRTIILTAHRLSSLKHCDVIFELARGRLARSCSYRELEASARAGTARSARGGG